MAPRLLQVPEDVVGAAQVLKSAFEEDPVMRTFLPGEIYDKHAEALYRKTVAIQAEMGLSYVLETDGIKAVALWEPPDGLPMSSLLPKLGRWLFWSWSTLGFKTTFRFLRFYLILDSQRQTHAPKAYCLTDLGTSLQGHGLGSKIIKPMLDRADTEKVPCFLASSNPKNISFYQRHGYDIVTELFPFKDYSDVPGDGPVLTLMYRDVPNTSE